MVPFRKAPVNHLRSPLMAIRAAFFDFGGVLTESPFEAFARFERTNGLPEGFIRRVNATNSDSNAWALLERNEIGLDEFAGRFQSESAYLGHSVNGQDVLALLGGELRPRMIDAVRGCAKSLRMGLLTNNFILSDPPVDQRGGDDPPDALAAVLSLFDVVVESSRVGCRKPDPRFYEIACELAGVAPSDVVYLDDLGVNLKPARAMGMTTIKVTDPDAAIAELEEVVGFALRGSLPGHQPPR